MQAMKKAMVLPKTLIKTLSTSSLASPPPRPPPPPSSAYYDELIDFAGRNRDFATVHHLLNKRVKHGCFNTTNTFNFISTDLSVLDDLLQLLNHLDGGLARKGSYNSLIAHLSKLRKTREALLVADEMVKKDYGAKAATFHPILNVVTRAREMGEAWRVMDLMREWGVIPDATCFNYLLTAYCYDGDLRCACEVLSKMREVDLKEDLRTYDALVLGACRWGRVEGGLMLLRRMVSVGETPLYSTYAHVVNAMCRDGFYSQAVEFVRAYGGRDAKLDVENFGVLAMRLLKLKRFDEASVVVEEMEKRNIAISDSLKCVLNNAPKF